MSYEPTMRHDAFVYDSPEEYVERSVSFVQDGLGRGEGCVVAHSRDGLAMMREALGPDASRVAFVDISGIYRRPARTVAAYYRAFRDELRRAPAVRAVADGSYVFTPSDWDEWLSYEAITNVAYAHLPVWVVCAYAANHLPDPVIDAVWQTHREVLAHDWRASDRFEAPRDLVRRHTARPDRLPDLRSFVVGNDLGAFRTRLAREMVAEKLPRAMMLDGLVAGTEIAANAVQHGAGIEEVRIGRAGGRFVCEVVDRGAGFDDPLAGYIVPHDGTGSGLWVARQLTWKLEFVRSPRGFAVRMWL